MKPEWERLRALLPEVSDRKFLEEFVLTNTGGDETGVGHRQIAKKP